jgi:hypothetical protein
VLQTEALEAGSVTHDYFLERSRFVRLLFAEALTQARDLGEIRADVDVAAKAAEIVAYLDGAAMVWLLDDQVSLVELYTTYFDDLARALAPTDGGTP